METKKLDIQQVVGGEKFNKTLYTFDEFKTELAINNISDIFSNNIKIKQDKQKYIFSINEINKFAIDGDKNLVNWVQRFYTEQGEKEKRKAEEKVLIRIQGLKLEYIKSKTQDELDLLKKDINKTDKSIEKATDSENVKYHIERNIAVLEQEKKLTEDIKKSDKIDKQMRKAYKAQIQERLDRLYRMKSQIEVLAKNKDKKYTTERETTNGKKEFKDVKMDDINGMDSKMTLTQISERLYKIEDDIPNFIRTRNEIINKEGDTTPYYEVIINDKSDAKKVNNALKKINKEYAILDELKLTGAKRQELSQDLQALEEYLNNVINNPNTFKPSEHPFVPTHTKDFYQLTKIDPSIFSRLNKEASTTTEKTTTPEANTGKKTPETNTGSTNNNTTTNTSEYANKDYIETFKTGGVTGVIRKTLNMFPNMSNEAKNTWANLLVVGGVGFGAFKLAKWLFTGRWGKKGDDKDKTSRWTRLLVVGGVTLGLNAFGSNPLSAAQKFIGGGLDFNTLKIQRPWAKAETVEDEEKELTYIELNTIFGTLPVSELKKFIDPKTFKMTEAGHNGLLGNFKGTDAESTAKRALIERMRKNKDNDILKTSFAKVGITPENIDNLNQSKTIKEYTESSAPTTENIDIRDNKDDERIKITDQVKNFNITEDQKKKLIKYGNILYDEKPGNSSQKVEFKEKDTKIYLKTYDEWTEIDIEKITISGYKKKDTSPIVFNGFKELMKAANLTNYMKSLFRGKATGNIYKPFEKAGLVGKLTWDRGDIMFNDGKNKYNPIHTEAIDGGRFGTLGKISKKLEDNKEEYINYLNDLNIWNESRVGEAKPE